MSLRFLNMNHLLHVRRGLLLNQACIGKGSFASVYASSNDSARVSKVTTDSFGYYMLADWVWTQTREEVDGFFPRVIEDHGDVGESCGLTAYLVEVERLFPVTSTHHRRLIKGWADDYDALDRTSTIKHKVDRVRASSINFCDMKAVQGDEPYSKVFGALSQFLGNYGGALDLKRSNFMCRADGTLVWNDIVFDAQTFMKRFIDSFEARLILGGLLFASSSSCNPRPACRIALNARSSSRKLSTALCTKFVDNLRPTVRGEHPLECDDDNWR